MMVRMGMAIMMLSFGIKVTMLKSKLMEISLV